MIALFYAGAVKQHILSLARHPSQSLSIPQPAYQAANCQPTGYWLPAAGYWEGAELSLQTGTGAGCRLKVAGYVASTGVVTLSGALPATPTAGDAGVVDFRGRLVPTGYPYEERQSLEARLSAVRARL